MKAKERAHMWAMIHECIRMGIWADVPDFREWMLATFGQQSTQLKNASDKTLFTQWLHYYTKRSTRKPSGRPSFLISPKQIWVIENRYLPQLGWSKNTLHAWIEKQLGKPFLIEAIKKSDATKLMTGMERLISFKQREQNKDNHETN